MNVHVRRDGDANLVLLDEETIGRVDGPGDLEQVVQQLAHRIRTRCSAACYERALGHHETVRKSKGCDQEELKWRAREAEKCAMALKEL